MDQVGQIATLMEPDDDSTKLQRIDVESNEQLTPTYAFMKNKMIYSTTTTKQQKKKIQKNSLKLQNNPTNFRKTIFAVQFFRLES